MKTTEIMADEFKIAYPLTYDEIFNRGYNKALENVRDIMTFNQKGLSGDFTILLDDWNELIE